MNATILLPWHQSSGARLAPFAGYNMPISYSGITEEHLAVRHKAGLFDVSHMGEFVISGAGALPLIQHTTTNDAARLSIGQAQYSCFTKEDGGILDDLLVYRLGEEEYMLVVNASNRLQDWNWLVRFNTMGAQMEDVSLNRALLALQGPASTEILQKLTDINLPEIAYYHFAEGEIASHPAILSATGYTGAGGYEIYVKNEYALEIWQKIMTAGKTEGLIPAGLGARDTLRTEMGYCLYGNDITEDTTPLEAGLSWIVKFTKDFIGRAALEKQKKTGVARRLCGFIMEEKAIPRHGCLILAANERTIGTVTSGTHSPILQRGVGMGYVPTENACENEDIWIHIRGKACKARIVKPPFISKKQ